MRVDTANKLVPLTSNEKLYDALQQWIVDRIDFHHKELEQAPDEKTMDKSQGAIRELKELAQIRARVRQTIEADSE